MQIVDNKALRLKVRNPMQITTAIPRSKSLGNNEVLVKWGYGRSADIKKY